MPFIWRMIALLDVLLVSLLVCSVYAFSDVGETILTSPQCLARVVSLPQADIALVLLEMIPGKLSCASLRVV